MPGPHPTQQPAHRPALPRRSLKAFSIVELLMVIAVIAFMSGLLLPALGRSRGAARALACASNLRQIAAIHAGYWTDHAGAIAGSPMTSGRDAMLGNAGRVEERRILGVTRLRRSPSSNPFFNGVSIQAWDWMGPLLHTSGWAGPGESVHVEGGLTRDDQRALRLDWYRRQVDLMACPSNRATAKPWPTSLTLGGSAPVWTAGPMVPYAMSTQFTSTTAGEPLGTEPRGNNRAGYTPKLERVGPPSLKALVFEGHRYTYTSDGPDFDHAIDAPYGGIFQDTGPWYNKSKALDRTMAPGEPQRPSGQLSTPARDNRPLAFRHGPIPRAGRAADTLGHVAYFDAHVDLLTDLQATNPRMWFPTGTRLSDPGEFWHSTRQAFDTQLTGQAIAP